MVKNLLMSDGTDEAAAGILAKSDPLERVKSRRGPEFLIKGKRNVFRS